MNDKRYYWLKLEENYFDLKVQKALRKLPSGSDMLICYLKMQLKYLNKDGLIEYQGIYDDLAQEIALDIDEEEDLVKMTLALLEKWNVIEPSKEGLYIAEMQDRIGSKSDVALRVAKHREKQKMLQCNKGVTKCNYIKDIDIEKDIDIKEKEINKEKETYGEFNNVKLTKEEYAKLEKSNLLPYIEKLSSYIASKGKKYKSHYATILTWARGENKNETPEWLDKEIPKKEISNEEQQELQNILNDF